MLSLLRNCLVDMLARRAPDFLWRDRDRSLQLGPGSRILLVQLDGKLGDSIMISTLPPRLKQRYPDASIAIATTAPFLEYWKANPLIDEVLAVPARESGKFRFGAIWKAARSVRRRFEALVLFEPMLPLDSLLFVRVAAAKRNIGVSKELFRLFHVSVYDRRFTWRREPILNVLGEIGAALGAPEDGPSEMFVYTTEESERAADAHTHSAEFNVYINGVNADPMRVFHRETLCAMVCSVAAKNVTGACAANVFLNLPDEFTAQDLATIQACAPAGVKVKRLPFPMHLAELFSLMRRMDLVISPDTGTVHVAAAAGVPLVSIYADREYAPIVWPPQSGHARILFTPQGKDINAIPMTELVEAAQSALRTRANRPVA